LISEDEKPRCKYIMKEAYKADKVDVPFIGAQWDARKATRQPPDAFDENVKYRSVTVRTCQ
jgi:hypothetical protein